MKIKKPALLILLCISVCLVHGQVKPSLHKFTAYTIQGDLISLSGYAGKKIMIVNAASYCSYTPQFSELQQLYNMFGQYNFEIIGFPCNDFGSQEPGQDTSIYNFCADNYGVTFQMMSKIAIAAGDTAPLYKWLQRSSLNGVKNAAVDWNFNKFLINESGNWVRHYGSAISPTDTAIVNWILSASSLQGLKERSLSEQVQILSPNPGNKLELLINDGSALPYSIGLYAFDGRLLHRVCDKKMEAAEKISFDLGMLPEGVYVLKITNGTRQMNVRLIAAH